MMRLVIGVWLLKAWLLDRSSPGVQRVRIHCAVPYYVRCALDFAQVSLWLIQGIAINTLLLKDLIQDLSICRMKKSLLTTICICTFSMIWRQLMVTVDNHGEQKLELAANHRTESPLWYAFLIFLEEVLKAFIKHGLNLIYLQKLCISVEKLIECLIENLQRNLLVLLAFYRGLRGASGHRHLLVVVNQ